MPRQTPSSGTLTLEQSADELVLVTKPGVVLVLVGVHRAAEDDHRSVVVERPRSGGAPREAPLLVAVACLLDHLGEHSSTGVRPVDDREDVDAFGITTSPRTNLDSFAVGLVLGFVSHIVNSSWPVFGGSRPPVAGIPCSSSSPRRMVALRGA